MHKGYNNPTYSDSIPQKEVFVKFPPCAMNLQGARALNAMYATSKPTYRSYPRPHPITLVCVFSFGIVDIIRPIAPKINGKSDKKQMENLKCFVQI